MIYVILCASWVISLPIQPKLTLLLHSGLFDTWRMHWPMRLFFKSTSNLTLTGFTDADWGSCQLTEYSTIGFCFFVGSSLISSILKKQTVSLVYLRRLNILPSPLPHVKHNGFFTFYKTSPTYKSDRSPYFTTIRVQFTLQLTRYSMSTPNTSKWIMWDKVHNKVVSPYTNIFLQPNCHQTYALGALQFYSFQTELTWHPFGC